MSYALITDMSDAYGLEALIVAGDFDGDGRPDTSQAEAALEWAAGEIDKKIGGRYSLPLPDPLPQALKWLKGTHVDLAFWRLCQTADRMTDQIEKRAEMALAQLDAIASGKQTLPGLTPSGGGAQLCAETRVMTRDNLRGCL